MLVFVKNLLGQILPQEVEHSDTVLSLMIKVSADFNNLPPEHMRMIFRGKQLEEHRTMEYYKVEKESTIQLVYRAAHRTVEVHVRGLTPEEVTLETYRVCVKPSDLRKQIEELTGIPAEKQTLTLNGEPFDDDSKSLMDYKLVNGSVLEGSIANDWAEDMAELKAE